MAYKREKCLKVAPPKAPPKVPHELTVGAQNLFPELYGGVRASVVEIPEKLDSFQSLQEVLRRIKVHQFTTRVATKLDLSNFAKDDIARNFV